MEEIKKFRKSLLAKVVRMEALESKFGIEINHLSLITEPESEYITINFELLATNGSSILENVNINFAFYDKEDSISLKCNLYIDPDEFSGFSIESVTNNLNMYAMDISRIVIYPSKY